MRLIDADVLIIALDERYNQKSGIVPDNLAEGFVQVEKLIKEQPTAYDVDKVLEQLANLKSGLTTWAEDEAYKMGIEKAFEIVKSGGID